MKKILLFLALAIIGSIEGNNISSIFQKCKKDENLNKCLTESANIGWPKLVESDSSWATIKLKPIDEDIINVAHVTYDDGELTGLENAHFSDIKVDFKKKAFNIIFTVPNLTVSGNADFRGNILGFNLAEKSPNSAIYRDGVYNFRFRYDLQEKNGEKYAQIKKPELVYNIGGLTVNFDSADRTKGARTNKLFNDNWNIINVLSGSLASRVFSSEFARQIQKLFDEVPFNSLFE